MATKKKRSGIKPLWLRQFKRMPRAAILVGCVLAVLGVAFLFKSFAATPSEADLNGDGRVNLPDLSILLGNFNKSGSGIKGDLDGNGKVAISDLSLLLANWNKTTGGGGPTGNLPGDVLNLKNWYLTLPTGDGDSTDTVKQPALDTYSSTYFKLNTAKDGVVFTAPVDGTTTTNSEHTRSELRETAANGTLPWGWSTGSGSHVMTATESVDHLPGGDGVLSFAQIHGPDSTWYLILKATGTGNGTAKLTVKDETGKIDGQVIASNYKLGTKFDLVVSAVNGKVTISYNGTQVASTTNSMSGSYFKIGSYNQSDGDYGQTTVYRLSVTHN